MKSLFASIFLLFISKTMLSQYSSNLLPLAFAIDAYSQKFDFTKLSKINCNKCYEIDFSESNSDELIEKTFQINLRNGLDEKKYNSIIFNDFGLQSSIGLFQINDTLNFSSNLNIDEINELIKNYVSEKNNYEVSLNKFGVYNFSVKLKYFYLSDLMLNFNFIINKTNVVIKSSQKLHLLISPTIYYTEFKVAGPYNSHLLAYSSSELADENGNVIGKQIESYEYNKYYAYSHLFYYSSLKKTRDIIKNELLNRINILKYTKK
jgi:hypothetical protein